MFLPRALLEKSESILFLDRRGHPREGWGQAMRGHRPSRPTRWGSADRKPKETGNFAPNPVHDLSAIPPGTPFKLLLDRDTKSLRQNGSDFFKSALDNCRGGQGLEAPVLSLPQSSGLLTIQIEFIARENGPGPTLEIGWRHAFPIGRIDHLRLPNPPSDFADCFGPAAAL